MFSCKRKIRLYDTDAAGLLFYANQMLMVQDTLEDFFEAADLPVSVILGEKDYIFPVVHLESSYLKPLAAGDTVVLEMTLVTAATTSFSFKYTIRDHSGDICGETQVTHVVVDKATGSKRAIPEEMREIFERMLLGGHHSPNY